MNSQWKFGVSRLDITPNEPLAMAGWGERRIAEGTAGPLWVKTLAMQDLAGQTAVLVTTDLLGLSRQMSEELAERALKGFGLRREQIIINSSHNHAGPVTGDLLHLYYDLTENDLEAVARYTVWLLDRIEASIGDALAATEPGYLAFEQGLCGLGVNRRRDQRARPDYENARSLPQVTDHDVPVLSVRSESGELKAIVFGYACHPTSYAINQYHGDWPGVAQKDLEEAYLGATALFVAGCGGDINPLPRFGRFHETLPELYGKILAASVCNVIDTEMRPLESVLHTAFVETALPLQDEPTASELENKLEQAREEHGKGTRLREIEHQLEILNSGQPLVERVPFPLHVWRIGSLHFIGLSGEPVVDYSLTCKQHFGQENTWVAGYCNELTSYIPSLRVLREGGYEGTDGMLEYGWPASYSEAIEDSLIEAIGTLMKQVQP